MSEEKDAPRAPGLPTVDVREYGGKREGVPQVLDRRLFMQLLVFDAPVGSVHPNHYARELARALIDSATAGVVYEDVNNPRGLALLTWSDDPGLFVRRVRPLFAREVLRDLTFRPSYTMLGRTYSQGHEPKLEYSLLERPREMALKAGWDWAVWYPLRRNGAFQKLEPHEQSTILREHASIGMAYGAQELAHDIRLACHGLDANDNEFVVGLIGKDLHPLSHVVQTMRKTRQTSEFIAQMGPFFVGHVLYRADGSPPPPIEPPIYP